MYVCEELNDDDDDDDDISEILLRKCHIYLGKWACH